jgi:hypothetical protein
MTENELEDFAELWMAACENSGFKTEPSDFAINLAFDVLEKYTLADISTAIVKHQRIPDKPLTPAIIESLITGISWLTPAEAWAIAQKRLAGLSVVLTGEISEAAGHAENLYLSNQKNAAKDDFVAVYNRLMLDAVAKGEKPRWFLNQTDEHIGRTAENKRAITEALRNGYISQHKALQLAECFGIEVQSSMTPLISAAPDLETRQKLQGLVKMLSSEVVQ